MKKVKLSEVLAKQLDADTAGKRASATRALNSYVLQRSMELDTSPHQILAGVRAALTKKKKKMLIN